MTNVNEAVGLMKSVLEKQRVIFLFCLSLTKLHLFEVYYEDCVLGRHKKELLWRQNFTLIQLRKKQTMIMYTPITC